jgi:hypothetical protein
MDTPEDKTFNKLRQCDWYEVYYELREMYMISDHLYFDQFVLSEAHDHRDRLLAKSNWTAQEFLDVYNAQDPNGR